MAKQKKQLDVCKRESKAITTEVLLNRLMTVGELSYITEYIKRLDEQNNA